MVYDSVYEANNYLRGTARKQHFWEYFSGSKLQEASATDEVTGGTTDAGFNSNMKGFGSKVQTGDTLVGKKITKLSIELKNNGSGVGGNITLGVFNTTSSTPVFTFGTFSASTLTSSYQYFEQENLTGHTLVADQVLGFIASGDISNLKVRRYNGGTGGRSTLYGMYHAVSSGSNWQDAGDAQDINMKVGYAGGTRWTIKNWNSVTGTATMVDEADGGIKLSSSGNRSSLMFNDIRQFSNTGSVSIWTTKKTVGTQCAVGLAKNSDGYFNSGIWTDFPTTAGGTINFYTVDNSGSPAPITNTTKGIAFAEDWHSYKMEISANTTAILSIDGVLDATRTASGSLKMPDEFMQPVAQVYNSTGGLSINYMEAYNT